MSAPAYTPDPSNRARAQQRLRYTSWAAVIMATIGFPPVLLLYVLATASCWGTAHGLWWCEIFTALPWLGLILSLLAYLLVLWLINQLGREVQQVLPPRRYSWRQAKQGYKGLDRGHHRLVRRVHRVSSVALAGLAAYISFQYFEADTLPNLAVAAFAYTAGELLNWQKFNKIKY